MKILTKENIVADIIQSEENMAYIRDGEVVSDVPIKSVMVADDTELPLLTNFAPGSIAFTAGFAEAWQKAVDGTWVQFIGGDD